jgi:anaerobic magnesium-protoporphyrin IX monomethyl ester cyclase
MEALDLLIVYPNNRHRAYGELMTEIAAITPPVDAGLLVAYARRAGLNAGLLDADQKNLSAGETAAEVLRLSPHLVCVCTDFVNSGDVTKMAAAGETVREIKSRSAKLPVVLQGVVPSAYPEKMLREEGPDYVCQGEAYQILVDLARHVKAHPGVRPAAGEIAGVWTLNGDEVISSRRRELVNPDDLPMTPWELMPPSLYRAHHWHCFDSLGRRSPYACLYTNMGCPYSCTFCSVNVVAGGPNFRARSPEKVMEEIDVLVKQYGVRNIRILDNVFTIRQNLVEQLCDLIIARGYDLNFWAYARVESIRSLELLQKMKKAGVNWLAYGIEAASERVRQAVDKPSNQKIIDRAVEWTQQAGISIVGNFIFGLPEDDLESVRESFEMAKRYNFEWANFYCAMAYPGTVLYDQVVKEGIELPKTWSGFGQYSADAQPLPTKYLKSQEILKFRDEAFIEYYTNPTYLRMMESKFGPDAVALIRKILTIKLPRNYAVAAK